MHVWVYYIFNYIGSFLRSRFSKFIFTEFLKAFWLILVFHARQMAVAVPRGLQLHGVVAGGRRSKGNLTMEQPGWEGLLWVPVVNLSFPHETLQALSVHRSWNCLPALLIIHYLWLPSRLLIGSVWFGVGDSYLQSLDQDVHVVMNNMEIWCRSNPDGTWSGASCPHMCHFQPHIVIGSVLLFSLLLWPLAHSCQEQLSRRVMELEEALLLPTH